MKYHPLDKIAYIVGQLSQLSNPLGMTQHKYSWLCPVTSLLNMSSTLENHRFCKVLDNSSILQITSLSSPQIGLVSMSKHIYLLKTKSSQFDKLNIFHLHHNLSIMQGNLSTKNCLSSYQLHKRYTLRLRYTRCNWISISRMHK